MSEQQQPSSGPSSGPSSEPSSEPSFGSSSDLRILFYDLVNKLNKRIQLLYNSPDIFDAKTLYLALRKIIHAFFNRTDIQKIDIFAVLNSLRKMDDVLFEHDSKIFKYCFSTETSLTVEESKITKTIKSEIIIDFLNCILIPRIQIIPSIQEDLIRLMYMDTLRKFGISPQIPNFEMTIETNYMFWCNFIGWNESKRIRFLEKCRDQLTCQPYFSKKDTKYYSIWYKFSNKSGYPRTPESFREFFDRNYIWNNENFRKLNENYSLNFIPAFEFAIPNVLAN